MEISIAAHIVGFVLWVGGIMTLSRVLAICAVPDESDSRGRLVAFVNRSFKFLVLPGLTITIATGLFQMAYGGLSFYMKEGWFHTKLTLMVVLLVATFVVDAEITKAVKGEGVNAKRLNAFHGVTGLILVATVFLTIIFRG